MGAAGRPGPFEIGAILEAIHRGEMPWQVIVALAVGLFLFVLWLSRRQAGG